MINAIVIFVVGVIVGFVIYSNRPSKKKDRRAKYLNTLAKFLNSQVEEIPDQENSYIINFQYKGVEFCFCDIEDPGFHENVYRGLLKAKLPFNFTVSFTEHPRARFKANISSIKDVVNPWAHGGEKVLLPKDLQDFSAFSNNANMANQLMADPKITRIFIKFKNRDSRGYPTMSLDIIEGVIRLTFHPPGGLQPVLFDIQKNAYMIEGYLDTFMELITKLQDIKETLG